MSAFMVSKEHIDAMVRLSLPGSDGHKMTWYVVDPDEIEWDSSDPDSYFADLAAARRESTLDRADEIGRMLAFENAASVLYRYSDDNSDEYVPSWTNDGTYRFTISGRCPTPVEGLKLIDCYEYQSCEHPGWKTSEARRFCKALRSRMIQSLPGYKEAPWEFTANAEAAR